MNASDKPMVELSESALKDSDERTRPDRASAKWEGADKDSRG